jgi:hypothetical protein
MKDLELDLQDDSTIAFFPKLGTPARAPMPPLAAPPSAPKSPSYVPEDTPFLALFPHRYDYLWAVHPRPGERPNWQTENRHPLSDRLILAGDFLYGVRFGQKTNYIVLDIDQNSPYHPNRDRLACDRMIEALEEIGVCSAIRVTSSYSGGIHLYFPFSEAVDSWKIASVASRLLEASGFIPAPGVLEILPNPRRYDNEIANYNGHRLPLQAGSYLLSQDWEIMSSSKLEFVRQWQFARQKNHLDLSIFSRLVKSARRHFKKFSQKASKFLNDLNACIEAGWSGFGQTNAILGRLAMRAYIFGHFIDNCDPYTGDRLILKIIQDAKALPGFGDWCRHQKDLYFRAEEWAKCIERSHYTPYRIGKFKPEPEAEAEQPKINQHNAALSRSARERIQDALTDLLNSEKLPSRTRDRFIALTGYGISGQTLYKHRDLWHPDHLSDEPPPEKNLTPDQLAQELLLEEWHEAMCGPEPEHFKLPPAPPLNEDSFFGNQPSGIPKKEAPSLLAKEGVTRDPDEDYANWIRAMWEEAGCNTPSSQAFTAYRRGEGISDADG